MKAQHIIDRLAFHADATPGKHAFRFLERGERIAASVSYQQLHAKTVDISSALRDLGQGGGNAILLFSDPLEFIQAFLGCLAAGVTAVPAAVPPAKNVMALIAIWRNADPAFVLAGQRERQLLKALIEEYVEHKPWFGLDDLLSGANSANAEVRAHTRIAQADTAFLQYTSGSTGTPKGVVVSHGNLMANAAVIAEAMRMDNNTVFVSWLPHYHDMGLIGCLLQPVYLGAECTLMRPIDFIQKPIRWLRAVSEFGATVSGGPNFAYDLCVDKISAEQREGLELGAWEIAFNGAEPVKASTITRFAAAFAGNHFKQAAIYPCYGMAESTLFVSGQNSTPDAAVKHFRSDALGIGADAQATPQSNGGEGVAAFVSCGATFGDSVIKIVHPETCSVLPEGRVGEVWVGGASVAQGYYKNPEASAATFHAQTNEEPGVRHLRTGDLGMLCKGELVILGRLKDTLIVRGRNYYPQDIEAAAQQSHAALIPGGGAVFQSTAPYGDQITLVHELERQHVHHGAFEQMAEAVRGAVTEQFGISLEQIVFIKPGQLPRTTSGKVRRSLCRDMFERGELTSVNTAAQTGATA